MLNPPCLLALSCPLHFPSFSFLAAAGRYTLSISYRPITFHCPHILDTTPDLPLQLQSPRRISISQSIPHSHAWGAPSPTSSPSSSLLYLLLSNISAHLPSEELSAGHSATLFSADSLQFQLTLLPSSQLFTHPHEASGSMLMSLLTPYSRHPHFSLPWPDHLLCTHHSVSRSLDVVSSNHCCFKSLLSHPSLTSFIACYVFSHALSFVFFL